MVDLFQLIGEDLLSQGDVRMVFERLARLQRLRVHQSVHTVQFSGAGRKVDVDHVRYGEAFDAAQRDIEGRPLTGTRSDLFTGDVPVHGQGAGRQHTDMGVGIAAGNQLAANIVQKLAERSGYVNHQRVDVLALFGGMRDIPVRIETHSFHYGNRFEVFV